MSARQRTPVPLDPTKPRTSDGDTPGPLDQKDEVTWRMISSTSQIAP